MWPLDPFDFSSIAAQLTDSYRSARGRIPDDWSPASAEDLHTLRQRVVDAALSDGIDRAAVAALRPDVDRRSRAPARPARPMPGSRSAQAAHRAASAAGALALAPDAGLRRTPDGARATRRAHRASAVRRTAESVPPSDGNAVGAREVVMCARRSKSALLHRPAEAAAARRSSPNKSPAPVRLRSSSAAGPSSAMRPVCST